MTDEEKSIEVEVVIDDEMASDRLRSFWRWWMGPTWSRLFWGAATVMVGSVLVVLDGAGLSAGWFFILIGIVNGTGSFWMPAFFRRFGGASKNRGAVRLGFREGSVSIDGDELAAVETNRWCDLRGSLISPSGLGLMTLNRVWVWAPAQAFPCQGEFETVLTWASTGAKRKAIRVT